MPGPVVFREKCCSWCGKLNWDSKTGGYNEDCTNKDNKSGKCDTNGEERKWDAKNVRVW